MSESLRTTPQELLVDTGWAARLARSLASDPSAADDLAQQAWLTALRQSSRETISAPRAWFRRVLANESFHEALRNARRVERERGAARAEALPSTADLVERAELQRMLADAVLALQEPYRSTILWRYFGELSSQAIAERLGVPASTVRNRLRRGLDLLRSSLERRGVPEARSRCLGFTAGSTGGGCVRGMQEGIAMGIKLKLGIAAALMLATTFVIWRECDRAGAAPTLTTVAEAPEVRASLPRTPGEDGGAGRAAATATEGPVVPSEPAEAAEGTATPQQRLEALRDGLRTQIESTMLGQVDPAFYLQLAAQLTQLEPGNVVLDPDPEGAIRFPLEGMPEGMRAEYRIRSSKNSFSGGLMHDLIVTLDSPSEPYVVGGVRRRPAEATLTLYLDPAGEVRSFGILTNLYARELRSGSFTPTSLLFSYDTREPLSFQGDVAGEDGTRIGVISETPLVLVGGQWPDLDALNQFNSGMHALHAKAGH